MSKTRIKLYLFKDETISEEYIKENIRKKSGQYSSKDNQIINFYYVEAKVPKWVNGFLELNEFYEKNSSVSCCFDRKVIYMEKEYRFAISIGGADSVFNKDVFVDNFGMKVVLNIVDKFVCVNKSNISTTMSHNKEYSIKKDNLSAFSLNIETDLFHGATVCPKKDNGISDSNITGGIALSLSVDCTLSTIDELLIKVLEKYMLDDYKKEYSFIDKIKAIENKILETEIHNKIIELIKKEDFNKIWFGFPYFEKWEDIRSFEIYKNKSEHIEIEDLNIEEITKKFEINNFDDIKKIKVIPNYFSTSIGEELKLSECLYGEVDLGGNVYIVNNNKYYYVKKDFVDEICCKYNEIKILDSLPERKEVGEENKYNLYVESINDKRYKSLDQKFYMSGDIKMELCDIFDREKNMFIHVKKSGASSVLSHLFFQAWNSAKLFSGGKENIIKYFKEKHQVEIPIADKYTVCLAIISQNKLNKDEHLEIPFFSKMSMIETIKNLNSMNFDAGVVYIYSSAKLHEQRQKEAEKIKV